MSCHSSLKATHVDEQVEGNLAKLPGCNPVDPGPGVVSPCAEEKPPTLNPQIVITDGKRGTYN